MLNTQFVHLKVHSDYSIIDGIAKIEHLIKKCISLKISAIAITDFSNIFGLIKFYKAALKAGIKPIIGADFLLYNSNLQTKFTELTILAANNVGYKNLRFLISKSYKDGYINNIPTINFNWIKKYREGLIVLSGGKNGYLGQCLMHKDFTNLNKCLTFYQKYFSNNYYIELTRTNQFEEEKYIDKAIQVSIHNNIPLVATNNVRFISSKDFYIHEIRVAIHDGRIINNSQKSYKYSNQQYLKNEKEMYNIFSDIKEALINSVEIAKRCNVYIEFNKNYLPCFFKKNLNSEELLIKYAKKGLKKRLLSLYPDINIYKKNIDFYKKRLENELVVINKMGFPSYFLILMEFIQWSKNNNIPVGPGRGSGAGSLVAYALQITELNPLQFNLLFERFLNIERISLPDFDIDFCVEKRDLVINHIVNIYGRKSVSQIITFGSLTAKAVIKDVGRVLGYPYGFVNNISKMIPSDPGITLNKALSTNLRLKNLYFSNIEIKSLINIARKLEGVVRNTSKHAGGIVISPTEIIDFTSLYYDTDSKMPITQFDKNDLEKIGLVKFDLLGLKTLTIINSTIELINNYNKKYNINNININNILLNDKKCFDLLKKANTTAIFQLESKGMKDLIKRIKPDCFEDIIALVALFRPGPLQSGMVDNFINRKHNKEIISYPDIKYQHKSLKPILESTYGVILYQEQIMQIAQVFAQYTLGEADILRRAMEKKQPEIMNNQKSIFQQRAKKIGHNKKLSMKIFNILENFAGYCFNKSHSAAYAMIAYQTLWLKSHYPVEFMSSVMTYDIHNTNKIVFLIQECYRMELKVLSPNINYSNYEFTVNNKKEIVYGMGAIKGIGMSSIKYIIKERNKNGLFKSLIDLCLRIDTKKINRNILEKLILSGSCDQIGQHRASLMNQLDYSINLSIKKRKNKITKQGDIFTSSQQNNIDIIKLSNIPKWPNNIILNGEKKTLGLYLTQHPIIPLMKEIKKFKNWIKIINILQTKKYKTVLVAGLVMSVKIIKSNKGNNVIIFNLDDNSSRIKVIYLTNILKNHSSLIRENNILIVEGNIVIDNDNNNHKLYANKITDFNIARKNIYLTDNNHI